MGLLRSALLLAISVAVSGDEACDGVDSCPDREVRLFQVKTQLTAPARSPAQERPAEESPRSAGLALAAWPAPTGSFLSGDAGESVCIEGDNRTVEGALAMRKAAPRGRLYRGSAVREGGCAERGYTLGLGEDDCYPGVFVYVRPGSNAAEVSQLESGALQSYAEQWHLTQERTSLMDACTCHLSSSYRTARAHECAKLGDLQGAWVHHDLGDFLVSDPPMDLAEGKELMCDGGPFELATRALAVLKSTAQLAMHMHDSIAPVSCAELNFTHQYPPLDHCFTGLRMSTKTAPQGDVLMDAGILESSAVESFLFGGGFRHGANVLGLDEDVLDGVSGCHCAPSSPVGAAIRMNNTGACDGVTSPIRDWWTE